MSIHTFMKVAQLLPVSTSVLLRAPHGVGKSQLGRQLAKLIAIREGIAHFPVIDRRLSQVSEGDIIGLPSTNGDVTRFAPPDWYMKACKEPVFLFLDELNRATPEVMQAAFQIVLDRELNGHRLHPQTRVMSAINTGAAYNVNEIDPALLDRFWAIDLTPDLQDWITWGRMETIDDELRGIKKANGGYNCAPLVVDFIANNEKWLDPAKDYNPGEVQVSRRSWERLGDALAIAGVLENANDELFYPMCLGYVGTEASISFVDYAKSIDNHFTGEDIVERYAKDAKVRAKVLNKKRQEVLNTAIDKVAEYVTKLAKVTDGQGKNLEAFMKDLPDELRISLWTKVTANGIDKLDLAKSLHKHLMVHILDVFGVKPGQEGVGMVPQIPQMFKNEAKK